MIFELFAKIVLAGNSNLSLSEIFSPFLSITFGKVFLGQLFSEIFVILASNC